MLQMKVHELSLAASAGDNRGRGDRKDRHSYTVYRQKRSRLTDNEKGLRCHERKKEVHLNSVCVIPAFSALACSVATQGARENVKLQQQKGHEGGNAGNQEHPW